MKDIADTKTIDMLKPAAKTNAERQREYRARKKQARFATKKIGDKVTLDFETQQKEAGYRLDMYISNDANFKLESLLRYLSLRGNATKKQLIERMIKDTYDLHEPVFPKDLFGE